MKIIHVTDELQPEAGGLVSVPINLAAAQAAEGHEVILLGRTGKTQLLDSGETEKIPEFDRVKCDDANQPGLAGKIFPWKALSMLKRHISEGSTVHLHGVWDPFLLLASLIARKRKASYIVTPHSMLHPWQMKRYVWQKNIVFAIGWRKMFNHAAFIHVLNIAEKDYVGAFKFEAPMEIIPNGIYLESLAAVEPNPFLKNHPELETTPYILFLSRLHNQKGITHLLDGFEKYASRNATVKLVLAGPDYGELPVIEKMLSSMVHASRVIPTGPIYGDEKIGALHAATCFALTSLNEGFSVAILEALACELPVVISENCFFPEVSEYQAGLIPSLDPSDIENAFSEVFEDDDKRKVMSANAKQLVMEHYTWERIGLKSTDLYEKYKI